MFEILTDRLQDVFEKIGRKGKLTEADVQEAMKEVRRALLEADVNFKIVKEFVARVTERSIGQDVLGSLRPEQQVIKIVHEELIRMLGEPAQLDFGSASPAIIMLVGLQGSGKTTTTAKLANYLRKKGQSPLMVAADVYRPAAIDQLVQLGKQLQMPVYAETTRSNPLDICRNGLREARQNGNSVVILDTAGRLAIDEQMMDEVAQIRMALQVNEVLLIADAMTGQDSVRLAEEFNARLPLSGLILTKMDGDAKGGAALSIRAVTNIPIKFISTGEKTDALEPFYPDRLAQRILGMGDVLSLIEKAEATISQEQAEEMEKKLRNNSFTLEDFLAQLQQIKKMGPLTQLMEMIPGMRGMMRTQGMDQIDDKPLKQIEAIINSMTIQERRSPDVLDGSRRRRIAKGSGTTVQDVNMLLKQFREMQQMMKQLTSGRMGKMLARQMGMGAGAGARQRR
ncbi:MAG TPA: signal recognition particle protein [Chloroflexota bacterium]|jgi:signal recognition particle subunit SRP54|nr:signal recognition particle protein [Chloroflexota bacterium]